MNDLKSYEDYNSLTSRLENLDVNWSSIKTVIELCHSVSHLLSEFGCKDVIFLNRDMPLIGKDPLASFHCFFIEQEEPPLEAKLNEFDKVTLMKKIDVHYSAQPPSTSPITTFSKKGAISIDPFSGYLSENYDHCIARHFGSTNRISYTIFTSHNGEIVRPGLVSNSLYVVLGLIHSKLAEIHSRTKHQGVKVTPREEDVLRSLIKGQTNSEIACDLDISPHTINSYIKALGLKLGTKNRTATAMNAIALGLVEI